MTSRRLTGCLLCGARTDGDYCHAPLWAANRKPRNDLARAAAYRDGFRDGYRRATKTGDQAA